MIGSDRSSSFFTPFLQRVEEDSGRTALVVYDERGRRRDVTRAELHRAALARARSMERLGISRDDLVVLVMRHSLELIELFLATAYLGAIPSVFAFLTPKLDPKQYRESIRSLAVVAEARAIVATGEFAEDLAAVLDEGPCQVIHAGSTVAQVGERRTSDLAVEREGGERIALLQFSSGTTGQKKGVAISHRAILNNVRARCHAFDLRADDVMVSWLPLYHDMGLISGLILPLLTGIRSVLFSPFEWVRNPTRLFQLVDEHRGSLCWMPNFAFNHCVRSARERDLEGLDLSCWRLLANGSEPVRQESMASFAKRFAPYGFKADSLAVAYGLAEATVGVSASTPGRPPAVDWVDLTELQTGGKAVPVDPDDAGATSIVTCGPPYTGTEVRIADDDGAPLPERTVGEVRIRSDSLFSGYYRRPDLTAKSLVGGWFRTGDLGYLAAGQLFVCGRSKDLMIVAGRNIHPHDIETIASRTEGIRPGRAVAFGVADERLGSEAVVVVCEPRSPLTDTSRDEIESALRRSLVRALDIVPWKVQFVPPGWIVKTSSGKLARSANRDKWLQS